ncbi:hypothetical protein CCP3SC5AM1_1480002 [Gammaproteobacteria bacterium]
MNQEILEKARKYHEIVINYDIMEDIRPSRLWIDHTNIVLRKAMEQQNIVNIIHYFQENNGSTYGRFNTDVNFYTTINKYSNWLKKNGLPVESLNMLVQESHLTSPKMIFNFEGRTVSTMFYWHLCAYWQVFSFLNAGGGGGEFI